MDDIKSRQNNTIEYKKVKRYIIREPGKRSHNEELNDLYSSPNMVRVIKSRRMRWTGHVARMGKDSGAYRFLVG